MKIQINNLTKKYGDKIVFENYSNTFDFDGILLIKGASGLGKTTLMRMIAGLEKADKGEIVKDAKSISFMFQEDRLIPFVSVLKNLSAVCSEEKAFHYLKLMGLESEKDNSPLSLSGGMRRRVSLARALCFDSDLVILDEPFKGLDEELKSKICEIIKEESKKREFIIISHDSQDAELLNAKIIEV